MDQPTGIADMRGMLKEAVAGQDDAALVQFAENLGGIEGFLDLTFEGMREVLVTELAEDAEIGWEIKHGDQTLSYVFAIKGGEATVEKRPTEGARAVLAMAVPVYMRLIAGEIDPIQATMQGKLQARGDLIFAMKLPQMFGIA